MLKAEDGEVILGCEPDGCPQCGGDIEWGSYESTCETVQRNVHCTECGCEWVSLFNFTSIVIQADGDKA